MKEFQLNKIENYTKEIMQYFSNKKDEQGLTKEETHLLLMSLDIRTLVRNDRYSKCVRQETVREHNREKLKEKLFKEKEIVYEGIVSDIYEPVYAADLTDLRRKMSKCANTGPTSEDFAKVIVYVNGKKQREELWTRKNACINNKWIFGQWLCKESKQLK